MAQAENTAKREVISKRERSFPRNSKLSIPLDLSTGCSFENTSTNKLRPQIDPSSLGRIEAVVEVEGKLGAEKAKIQVLGKRIMLHFLLLPDFQEERPRSEHKIHTLKWIRL